MAAMQKLTSMFIQRINGFKSTLGAGVELNKRGKSPLLFYSQADSVQRLVYDG